MLEYDTSLLEKRCQWLIQAFGEKMTWKWDNRFETILAEFNVAEMEKVKELLSSQMDIVWNQDNGSTEGWQLYCWVFQDSEEDFAALVELLEASSDLLDELGVQRLPVLDERLLDQLQQLVRPPPHFPHRVQHQTQVLHTEVAVQPLIHQLALNGSPELIVLKL